MILATSIRLVNDSFLAKMSPQFLHQVLVPSFLYCTVVSTRYFGFPPLSASALLIFVPIKGGGYFGGVDSVVLRVIVNYSVPVSFFFFYFISSFVPLIVVDLITINHRHVRHVRVNGCYESKFYF